MKKIYHLSTCSTNQRILKGIQAVKNKIVLQDIKTEPITSGQLDAMKEKAGSYEALFSRKSLKYRSMGLHEQNLTEQDYRDLILKEYTFLKRPVAIIDNNIFIGNSKAVVEQLQAALQ